MELVGGAFCGGAIAEHDELLLWVGRFGGGFRAYTEHAPGRLLYELVGGVAAPAYRYAGHFQRRCPACEGYSAGVRCALCDTPLLA